mmetsp:Transcript_19529/g.33395  ORF Transcript_19529/g.33395 Transcript_19529/m.33395 type:complete len:99 (-) Transcript_19529:89-385(-)
MLHEHAIIHGAVMICATWCMAAVSYSLIRDRLDVIVASFFRLGQSILSLELNQVLKLAWGGSPFAWYQATSEGVRRPGYYPPPRDSARGYHLSNCRAR